MMLKSLCCLSLLLFAGFPALLTAQGPPQTLKIALTKDSSKAKPAPLSKGFTLKQLSFDASATVESEKEKSGVEFSSYKPGSIWSGELPPFFAETVIIGGEDEYPITDVLRFGPHLFGLYGNDHYQTRVISVVNQNRHNPFEFSASEISDIAFCALEGEILYYTVVEGNLGEKSNARLHAFSITERKQIWETETGVAHGNFIIRKNHILTYFGFTGEDDFLCVIDRGTGDVLKKEKLKTAANCLIEEEDGSITIPAYEGVYRYNLIEKE